MIHEESSSIFTAHNNENHVKVMSWKIEGFNMLWNTFQEQGLEELYGLIYSFNLVSE